MYEDLLNLQTATPEKSKLNWMVFYRVLERNGSYNEWMDIEYISKFSQVT